MTPLDDLPEEQLRELALIKNRKGNATSKALQAQRILHLRSGEGYSPRYERKNTARDDYHYGDPEKFTKRFK